LVKNLFFDFFQTRIYDKRDIQHLYMIREYQTKSYKLHRAAEPPVCLPVRCSHADRREYTNRQATKRINKKMTTTSRRFSSYVGHGERHENTRKNAKKCIAIKTFVLLLFSMKQARNQKFMEQCILTIVLRDAKLYTVVTQ